MAATPGTSVKEDPHEFNYVVSVSLPPNTIGSIIPSGQIRSSRTSWRRGVPTMRKGYGGVALVYDSVGSRWVGPTTGERSLWRYIAHSLCSPVGVGSIDASGITASRTRPNRLRCCSSLFGRTMSTLCAVCSTVRPGSWTLRASDRERRQGRSTPNLRWSLRLALLE